MRIDELIQNYVEFGKQMEVKVLGCDKGKLT
jgi:hypothetical protein